MPEKIRIAYLVSHYPATSHTFILREVVALRALGFDIQVIAIRGEDRPAEAMTAVEQAESKATFTVLPFGKHFLSAHFATVLRNPAAYCKGLLLALKLGGYNPRSALFHIIYFAEAVVAGHAARQAGFRHVHTHFSSTVGLIASRIFGLRFSITLHGSDEFRDPVGFAMREKVANSVFISTISQYARGQIMLSSNPEDWPKIEICRLGVDPGVFLRGPAREEDAVFRVICVGRLVPLKAHRILIQACARLVLSGWRLQLHLVGSGPDAESLRQYVESVGMGKHVVFEGSRNQDEVLELYRRADVFALASFVEGVPVVLMEAMAMELPCVATWVNGIPELIVNDEEGLLVAPSDMEGLSRALERLVENRELRQRLGQAGRRRVLRDYDLRKNTASLAEAFRKYYVAE